MCKINISDPGNHFANPLLSLAGREFATRHEACEALYEAMYPVIDSETGCEMVDRPDTYGVENDLEIIEKYARDCREFIHREGYATEDGVTATVEEI